MPTHVPDRAPTFDPASQRWHWWSTPGQPSSLQQDRAQAEAIEVAWETYDLPDGKTWVAVTPVLPGFAPFLWNLANGRLWLRRPEGTWVFPLPAGLRRKDQVLVQEPCEGLRMSRRYPLRCPQAASSGDWHHDGLLVAVTPESHDQALWGNRPPVMVNEVPVILNREHRQPPPDGSPYLPLFIEPWSRPGPVRFAYHPWSTKDGLQDALIITLPNGVNVLHPFGLVSDRMGQWPVFQGLAIVMGDNLWDPQHVQPVIIEGADPVPDQR